MVCRSRSVLQASVYRRKEIKVFKMKKALRLAALSLVLILMGSCANTPSDIGGLVVPDDTLDPNATIITAPPVDDTDDVNVRVDTTEPVDSGNQGQSGNKNNNNKNDNVLIKFLAAGDNIIHENVYTDARARAKDGQKYNFIDMYDGIADMIASADLAFINQETPICGDEMTVSGYPNFNTPEAAGDALIELGFDIINVANNHVLDKKEAGYRNTLDYWHEREDKVTMLGGYYNKADYENIRVVEKNGVSIAFISYTYDTNGMYLPAGSTMYVPYINEAEIVRMTKKADTLADLVFVVMHWGVENSFVLSSSQKNLASAITEAGADVIIGMHPHVIQNMEWKTASDGSRTLVIYSLGNLISTQYDNMNLVGGMVTFDIVRNSNGQFAIENPIYNPTVTHYNKQRLGLEVYLMEDYTEELVALHGCPNYGQTADRKIWTLDKIRGFAKNNLSDEFLPDFLK